MRDLLIAGGGPVGLATALYAARAGLDVTILERRGGVIDKACGEGLMPGAVAALTDLGVRLDGHPITGIRYVDDSSAAVARFRHGEGLGVRRTTLHAALLERVAAAGIEVRRHTVAEVEDAGDHVRVDGVPARHLVAADGLHSPVRRMLGLDHRVPGPRRFGLRQHLAVAPWVSMVEVHWSPVGEAYVTPVADDRVGVAVLSDQRRLLGDLWTAFPSLAPRLRGVLDEPISQVRGAGPMRQRSTRRVAGRTLLVGDAAGYVDALTGEGLALGLAQARAAVTAIAAGDPASYELTWRRLGRRHDLLTRGLVGATRNLGVRRRIVPVAAAVPWLFGAAVNQLARPA